MQRIISTQLLISCLVRSYTQDMATGRCFAVINCGGFEMVVLAAGEACSLDYQQLVKEEPKFARHVRLR